MRAGGRGLTGVVALLSVVAIAACDADADRALGADLFEGRAALVARLVGHTEALPAPTVRCANCHAVSGSAPAGYGPTLSAAHLTDPQPRRGGPASRYDQGAFCRLLRTGIDPAHVQVPAGMPRYELSDAQCAALWAYLSQRRA